MKDNIVELDKHIKAIPAAELQKKIGNLKNSELMRTIILNERDYGTCTYDRTLRSLWYSTVKPTLDKLGKLTADDDTEKGLTAWDKLLSNYLAELVRAGKLSYKDLHIEDGSRSRNVPGEWEFAPYRNIVAAVEKDTVYSIVKDIGELLGATCLSAKGLNSLGAMESLIRAIRDNSEGEVREIRFLILSDYDPAGFKISNTIEAQAKDVLKVLQMDGTHIISERIGITPNQLTEEELLNNAYSPKGDMDKWLKETGGISGQPKGLELDSLTPDRIREIFATSLKPYIDSSVYEESCKNSYLHSRVSDEIRPYVTRIINEIVNENIGNVDIKSFDILEYLKNGYSFIPLQNICRLSNDNLKNSIAKYFSN